MRNSLRIRLTIILVVVMIVPLVLVGSVVAWRSAALQGETAVELQHQIAQRVATQVESFVLEREAEMQLLTKVRQLRTITSQEQTNLLFGLLAYQDVYNDLALLDENGQELARVSRLEVLLASDLVSRAGAEEFETPKASGATYFSEVKIDPSSGVPYMTISLPLYSLGSGAFQGVLAANFRFKAIWDLMASAKGGSGSTIYMLDTYGRVVAHANPSVVLRGTQYAIPADGIVSSGLAGDRVALGQTQIKLGNRNFTVAAELPASQALALGTEITIITLILVVVSALVAALFGYLSTRQITRPLEDLAVTAQAIAAGDLDRQVRVVSKDEIGALAMAFNAMTAQLHESITLLEQRVAARTQALTTSTEVSRHLSTILNQRQLAETVVEEVRQAFGYYHVQIYLLDETGQDLVMVGGTGEAGQTMLTRRHQIPSGRGLVGQAAETNQTILVPDTSADVNWLPNPLLPETRSEVAVPISSGQRVLGVIDVQHNIFNGLSQQDAELLRSIANQVAVAVQNARVFTLAQQQAERETVVNLIARQIQAATTVEDTLRIAVRELAQALGARQASVQLGVLTKEDKRSDDGHLRSSVSQEQNR